MAGIGLLISSLISSVTKLLPEVKNSFFAPSSSSSTQSPDANALEDDLNKLMRTLKRIKATLYDAEERDIKDESVKLWLKELKEMAHEAEYEIDEYMYEVYRAQIETRNASELNPRKRKLEEASGMASCAHSIRVPDGFGDRIREIRNRFDEIAKDREALQLHAEDGLRRDGGARGLRVPSSHMILEPNVLGRESDREKLIDLLFSNTNEGNIKVLPIVGKGGIGKTTFAQLVYNDGKIKQNFEFYGWICVSEDFFVEPLIRNLIESFTGESCSLNNLGTLQEKLKKIVEMKRVFIVLDDVWNEDNNLWKLILAPFMSALRVAFIITTRSDRVAKIMQTTDPFRLGYLSEEESWSLFQHYAFGDTDYIVHPNLLNLGRLITKKCGGLPLAIKSISNLLRHEHEESWAEILKNELWEMHTENDIFGALQISYNHMPAYMRPCFLYCCLFPKDYVYDVDEITESWIAQGYIESKEKRTLEEIAFEYAVGLRERSFFDPIIEGTSWKSFKIHDIIHDLARKNVGDEVCSIERGKRPNILRGILHMYMDDFKGLQTNLNFNYVERLRTLIIDTGNLDETALIDFSVAKSLRVLSLDYNCLFHFEDHRYRPVITSDLSHIFSFYHLQKLNLNLDNHSLELEILGNLVNLKFLCLSGCYVDKIPESLCFLSNLRRLSIKDSTFTLLPENIGNLICLEKLFINSCGRLCLLPESLCKLSGLKTLSLTHCREIRKLPDEIGNLTKLQNLIIEYTRINYLPSSFRNLINVSKLSVEISANLNGLSSTISCLKDFNTLKGVLGIEQLECIPSLEVARNFNLISKPNLEALRISWVKNNENSSVEENKLIILLDMIEPVDKPLNFLVLESLQPHPNLRRLSISSYNNPIFPRWMGDRLSCASLEEIWVCSCDNIKYLPFGNLKSLKRLNIIRCISLLTISRDSLPLHLQTLYIRTCFSLLSVKGLEDLESLDILRIVNCDKLKIFSFELISEERCYKSSSSGLKGLIPPKKLDIAGCPDLRLVENKLIPSVNWNINIHGCPALEEWCLRHNIKYSGSFGFPPQPF